MEHGGYRVHRVFNRVQDSILHEEVCMGEKGMEGSRANPDIYRDGKASRRQLMKKKMDGHEDPPLCAVGDLPLVHRKSQPFLKKKSMI